MNLRTIATNPPDDFPVYRLLTGQDDAAFCHRVSAELARGYRLHGSPSMTFNGQVVVAAQAIVWPSPMSQRVAYTPGGIGTTLMPSDAFNP